MMGYKIRNFKTYTSFSLEDLVPEDNFYRQVEQCIDLSFVRDLVRHLNTDFGRPSVETVSLNLAHRWFIGYDLDESVPDHSSLSKIRERYGMGIFQQFFE